MFKQILPLLLVLACVAAHAEPLDDVKTLPPVDCQAGEEQMSFSLSPSKTKPTKEELATVAPSIVKTATPPKGNVSIRLDVCIDATDEARLERVIFNFSSMSSLKSFTRGWDQFLEVSGLQSALFGDTSELKIVLRDRPTNDPKLSPGGLVIKGLKASSKDLVIGYPVRFDNGQMLPSSIYGLVGELTEGDWFAAAKCKGHQNFVSSQTQLGSASLTVDMCTYLGGGMTTGFDILKITVVDSSPLIATPVRGKAIVLEGDSLQQAVQYKWHHHNACDSMILTVKEYDAQYAATSAPMAGCGTVLPGAPVPDHDVLKARTQSTYAGESSPIEYMPGHHFLSFFSN